MDEDYRKKVLEYLKKNTAKGYDLESLKWALIKQGYARPVVERAIEEISKEEESLKTKNKEKKPKIKHEFIGEDNRPIKPKKPFWKRFLDGEE